MENEIAFVLCVLALVPYALFVLFYALRSPWYGSPIGRSLMLSKAVIVALLSHVLVVLKVGDYPGRLTVWAVLLVLAAVAGGTQLAILLKEQRRVSRGGTPQRRATDNPNFQPKVEGK